MYFQTKLLPRLVSSIVSSMAIFILLYNRILLHGRRQVYVGSHETNVCVAQLLIMSIRTMHGEVFQVSWWSVCGLLISALGYVFGQCETSV